MRQIKHPNPSQIQLTDLMYALSDPTRIEIVRRLAKGCKLNCNELYLDRPKSTMSHHFKILREAGLVETRVEGKEHLNSLRTAEIEKKFPGFLKAVFKLIK